MVNKGDIRIGDTVLAVCELDEGIGYLGAVVQLDGGWHHQIAAIDRRMRLHAHAIHRNKV